MWCSLVRSVVRCGADLNYSQQRYVGATADSSHKFFHLLHHFDRDVKSNPEHVNTQEQRSSSPHLPPTTRDMEHYLRFHLGTVLARSSRVTQSSNAHRSTTARALRYHPRLHDCLSSTSRYPSLCHTRLEAAFMPVHQSRVCVHMVPSIVPMSTRRPLLASKTTAGASLKSTF